MKQFYNVDEIPGLHADAVLMDNSDEAVFLSLWGRETAIQELRGKLSVEVSSGGIRELTLIPNDLNDKSGERGRRRTLYAKVSNTDEIKTVIGQMPKQSVFGRLLNLWLFQRVVVEPDGANRRAWLVFNEAEPVAVEDRRNRIWAAVKETCNLPLLDHWRDPILGVFRAEGWIQDVEGVGVDAVLLDLGSEDIEGTVSGMIQGGSLPLEADPDEGCQSGGRIARLSDSELLAELGMVPRTDEPTQTLEDIFGPPVSVYTRAQAIDDGCLVDVSEVGREAGFKWPVALTRAAWEDCVAWNDEDSKRQTEQQQSGRLWDVVMMAHFAIKGSRDGGTELLYELRRVPRGGRGHLARRVKLKLVTGPGDDAEPVVTIMMPDED